MKRSTRTPSKVTSTGKEVNNKAVRAARPSGGGTPLEMPVVPYSFPGDVADVALQVYAGKTPDREDSRILPPRGCMTIAFAGYRVGADFFQPLPDGSRMKWSEMPAVRSWNDYLPPYANREAVIPERFGGGTVPCVSSRERGVLEALLAVPDVYDGLLVGVSSEVLEVWGWVDDVPVVAIPSFCFRFADGTEGWLHLRAAHETDRLWNLRARLLSDAAERLGCQLLARDPGEWLQAALKAYAR